MAFPFIAQTAYGTDQRHNIGKIEVHTDCEARNPADCTGNCMFGILFGRNFPNCQAAVFRPHNHMAVTRKKYRLD